MGQQEREKLWAAEKAAKPLEFHGRVITPLPKPSKFEQAVVSRRDQRLAAALRPPIVIRVPKPKRQTKPLLDMPDPFSRTQLMIQHEFDQLVSHTLSHPTTFPDRRVTHDSGWYCPIPGRPLPPIERFIVA